MVESIANFLDENSKIQIPNSNWFLVSVIVELGFLDARRDELLVGFGDGQALCERDLFDLVHIEFLTELGSVT